MQGRWRLFAALYSLFASTHPLPLSEHNKQTTEQLHGAGVDSFSSGRNGHPAVMAICHCVGLLCSARASFAGTFEFQVLFM